MSGSGPLPMRQGVGWSEALTLEYVGSDAPSAASCNSALIEVVLLADRLVAGTELMNAARTGWVMPVIVGTEEFTVGGPLSQADLRPIDAAERVRLRASFTDEAIDQIIVRRETALALAQVGRAIGQASAGGLRVAGWVQLTVAVGAVAALVGLAVDWYCQSRSRADQATRVQQGGIVAASRLTSERLRRAAETGQPMAPPSEIETAAVDSIRQAAQQAREAGIGQTLRDTAESVSSIAKAAMWVGGLWVGYKVFSGGSKGT